VTPGCWSAVGQWELIVSHSLRPYSARPAQGVARSAVPVIPCSSRYLDALGIHE
jgi:hypothetical protein